MEVTIPFTHRFDEFREIGFGLFAEVAVSGEAVIDAAPDGSWEFDRWLHRDFTYDWSVVAFDGEPVCIDERDVPDRFRQLAENAFLDHWNRSAYDEYVEKLDAAASDAVYEMPYWKADLDYAVKTGK